MYKKLIILGMLFLVFLVFGIYRFTYIFSSALGYKKSHSQSLDYVPRYADKFTKLLEHNKDNGILTQAGVHEYEKLLYALKTGNQNDFNNIQLSSLCEQK